MENQKIFNSKGSNGSERIQLATGYISSTKVLFEKEKILVKIEAKGLVEFFDTQEKLLQSVSLPVQTGGREVYDEVECSAQDSLIILKFPVVEWIDNYPHCDGEHDRWDRRTIGCHRLTYNLITNEYTID